MKEKNWGLVLIFLSVLLVDIGQLFLKYGMNQVGGVDFQNGYVAGFFLTFLNPFVFIGAALFVSSSVSWLLALSKAPLSYAYPLLSIGYVVVSLLSWWIFNDSLSAVRLLGLSTIVGGVFLLSRT